MYTTIIKNTCTTITINNTPRTNDIISKLERFAQTELKRVPILRAGVTIRFLDLDESDEETITKFIDGLIAMPEPLWIYYRYNAAEI